MAVRLFMHVFSDDIAAAPLKKVLLAWGNGGWRFMKRDEVGQWRNMEGRPKPPPKMWSLCPEEATGGQFSALHQPPTASSVRAL